MSVSVAIWYAVGNIIGPYFFKDSEAPYYPMGIHAMEASFCIMAFTGFLYYVCVKYENKQKERQAENCNFIANSQIQDQSDKENVYFKYVY